MAFLYSKPRFATCNVSQFRCTSAVGFQFQLQTTKQKPTDLQGGLPNEKATWLVVAGVSGPKNDMKSIIPGLNAEIEAQLTEFPEFDLTSAASNRGRGKFSTYAKERWNKVPDDGLAHYARAFPRLYHGTWMGAHTKKEELYVFLLQLGETHKEMVARIEQAVHNAMQTCIGFVEDSAPCAELVGPDRVTVTPAPSHTFQLRNDDACGGQKKSVGCLTDSSDEDSTPDCPFGIYPPEQEDALPSVPTFELPVQSWIDVQRPTLDATSDKLWTYIRALEGTLEDVNTRLRAEVASHNLCRDRVDLQVAQIEQLEKSVQTACPKIANLQSRCETYEKQQMHFFEKNRQLEEEVIRLQEQISRLEPSATTFCHSRQSMMAHVFNLADNAPMFEYKQVFTDESVLRKFQDHLNTLKVCKDVWTQYGESYGYDWKKMKKEFHFNSLRTNKENTAMLCYDDAMLATYLFGSFE